MSKIIITMSREEAQALADIRKIWRKEYQPDAHQVTALAALHAAAVRAFHLGKPAQIALRPVEAAALLASLRGLQSRRKPTSHQQSALAKIRWALRGAQREVAG